MNRARSFRWVGLGLRALLLGACGGSLPYPSSGPEDEIRIVVDNTRSSFSSMTVHLLGPDGSRIRLGEVGLRETKKTFTLQRTQAAGTYRLTADPLGRSALTSHTFPLARGDVVEWDLRENFVQRVGRVVGG